jgi:hypothetical protein
MPAVYKHLTVLPILAAYLTLAAPAATQTPSSGPVQQAAPDSAGASDFAAWDNFTDQLRQIGHQMIAKLPDRLRDDPQVRQEAGRLLLEALASRTIAAISADGNHPMFLPTMNLTLNAGTPNADTTYRSAVITAGGEYRLRGEIGSLRVLMLGQSGHNFDDFKTLHLDKAGHFDVILSPIRPQGYTGDWWQLAPTVKSLLLRQVAFDWATERDPRVSIERLDKPVERPRPDAADLEQRLNGLAAATGKSALMFVDHVEGLRQQGFLNRLHEFDVSHLGGLVGQFYYEGAYELKPEEALIIQAKVPSGCAYWSILLTNDIYETTDWYNNQSSLNGSQARVDRDGLVRFVVSSKDPGVPNWLDTAGYPSGAIQGRWNGCANNPIPTVQRVASADVRQYLPADTPVISPAQRDEALRERRSEVQQRPLW